MKQSHSVSTIVNALSYVNQFYGKSMLIKIGGSILYDDELIQSLCEDLKLLKGAGINIILVHGGSKAINEALLINHIKTDFINGLRVTTKAAMKVIEMALCGHVNPLIVRKLNHIGLNAVGLSGSDSNMLLCDYVSQQHGCVGKIKVVNTAVIQHLLALQGVQFNCVPVIAPIGIDDHGISMNINADLAACEVAAALGVDKLIYLTDQDGIYDKNKKLLSVVFENKLQQLITDQVVQGGMLIKADAILSALKSNINDIHILNGKKPHILIEELFTKTGVGTLCKIKNPSKIAVGEVA